MPRLNSPPASFAARAALIVSSLLMIPVAGAETIPASVRACTQETDSLKRLICFDREIARYTGQPAATQGGTVSPAPPASAASANRPLATPSAATEPAAAPSKPKHISAHIVSIESFPDSMVIHLDNNEIWQQIQEASSDPNLRVGDTVTIDREMGAYWLSAGNGSAIKVRQKN